MKAAFLRTEERNLLCKKESLISNQSSIFPVKTEKYSEELPSSFADTNLRNPSEVTTNQRREFNSLFSAVQNLRGK